MKRLPSRPWLKPLATLAVIVAWGSATVWLADVGSVTREVVVSAPAKGQVKHLPYGDTVTIEGTATGFDGCTVGQTGIPIRDGVFRGPVSLPHNTYGRKLLWLDVQCPESDSTWTTAARYSRHLNIASKDSATTGKAEVARIYLKLPGVRDWLLEQVERPLQDKLNDLEDTEKHTRLATTTIKRLSSSDLELQLVDGGFVVSAAVDMKVDIRFKSRWYARRKATWSGRVSFPVNLKYIGNAWKVDVGLGTAVGATKVSGGWVPVVSLVVNIETAIGLKEKLAKTVTCETRDCARPQIASAATIAVNKLFGQIGSAAPDWVAKLMSQRKFGTRVADLARRTGVQIVRGNVSKTGHMLYFSLAVDRNWLGAAPPNLLVADTRYNDAGVLVSFALLNRFLGEFFDRPFCQQVMKDLRAVLRTVTVAVDGQGMDCGFRDSLLRKMTPMLRLAGLEVNNGFHVPLRLRPSSERTVTFFASVIDLFTPLDNRENIKSIGLSVETKASLKRTAGAWIADIQLPENAAELKRFMAVEPVPSPRGHVSERARTRYNSFANRLWELVESGQLHWASNVDAANFKGSVRQLLRQTKWPSFKLDSTCFGPFRVALSTAKIEMSRHALHLGGKIKGRGTKVGCQSAERRPPPKRDPPSSRPYRRGTIIP